MSGTIQPAQTGAQTIASGGAGVFPTTFGYYPAEGSRCISAVYPWASVSGYQEDLSQLEARGVETTIQSAYVDNSLCGQPVSFLVLGTQQVIAVGPGRQACIPLFFTGTPLLQISVPTTDAGVTRVFYLNVPGISASSWSPFTGQEGGNNIAQTVVTVPATTSTQVIAARADRSFLSLVNIGTGDAWLSFNSTPATVNGGWPLMGAASLGQQGGGYVWDGTIVPVVSLNVYSTAGTTIVVMEGW